MSDLFDKWQGFKGSAKRIDDIDLPRIGHRIGVGEDEIHAFMDVEASGSGFDKQGRPKMLFEPHLFYRNVPDEKRQEAIDKGLAYKEWKRDYPSDSYPRLFRAMEIDEHAALKSASWGLGQILGENYRAAGYKSPEEMIEDFMEDEENHLNAMVSFIIANKIDDDLKAHRWETVARVYNGPQYAKHNYHGRMAARYKWWTGKKDTPWSPKEVPIVLPPKIEIKKPVAPRPTPGIWETIGGFFKRTRPAIAQTGDTQMAEKSTGMLGGLAGLVVGAVFGGAAASSSIDLSRAWNVLDGSIGEALAAVALAIITWGVAEFRRRTGISIEAKRTEWLHQAAVSGINNALAKIGDTLEGRSIEPGSPLIAMAINYMIDSIPETLAKKGLDPESGFLKDFVMAKAKQVLDAKVTGAPVK